MSIADERNAKEGFLSWRPFSKKGKFKEQYFVLRDNHLFWFRNASEASKTRYDKVKKSGKLVLHLKGARVQPSPDPASSVDNQFLVTVVNGEQFVFVAPDSDTATDWIELVKEASQGELISREMVEITQRLRRAGHDIPPDDLEFDDSEGAGEIGRGASGIVRKGSWLRSPVAVKALGNVPEFTDPKELIQFYKEIETLSKLRSPYVVQMFGFSKKEGFLCLVTEFVGGGNLARQLENETKNFLDDALKVEFALNISRGMIFLHNIGLIHRDLKPANVLIESWNDGKVKICDFGLSTIATQKKSVRSRESATPATSVGAAGDEDDDGEVVFGSPQYAAPELRSENHTEKVDVFSFAIILWQIDQRTVPWRDELQWAGQYAERYENGQRPAIPSSCVYTVLIKSCWAPDPTARPSFKEIFEVLEGIQKSRSLSLHDPVRLANLAAHTASHAAGSAVLPIAVAGSPQQRTLPSPVPIPKRGISVFSAHPSSPQAGLMMTTQFSSPDLRGSPTLPAAAAGIPGVVEKLILDLFRGGQSLPWSSFSVAFCHMFGNIPLHRIECLQAFVTDDAGTKQVLRSKIDRLLQWFVPLSIEESSNYQTGGSATGLATGGYDLEMVLDVIAPIYFHGHLSPDQAQALLRDQPEGTYLFRFSSTPGAYTLSVSYHNVVGHWRIQCVKKTNERPKFLIEHREYRSLRDIIQIHGQGGESLRVTRVVPGQPATCFLGAPLAREAGQHNIYNA